MYRNLQRKIIALTLVVSLAPLLILGMTLYYQFEATCREKTKEQIRYRAQAQAEAVDLFLKERTAILNAMADTHTFDDMIDEKNLARIFDVMNARAGAFVDLGVIDSSGTHRAYVGPYDLRGRNYFDQPWFNEVMSKGHYKSDVYMGFRRSRISLSPSVAMKISRPGFCGPRSTPTASRKSYGRPRLAGQGTPTWSTGMASFRPAPGLRGTCWKKPASIQPNSGDVSPSSKRQI